MLKVRSNRLALFFVLSFLVMCGSGGLLHARQTNIRLNHISIDSLVNFVRGIHPKTYFISDGLDQANYTVEAPREKILESIISLLKEKGYAITYFDDGIYILRTVGFATELPIGYFNTKEPVQRDTSIYLDQSGYKFTFANKVYEIGESNSGVTGNVYLSGHITDVATGEPLVGISILEESTGIYAQSDATGFYRILLPVGEHILKFSGYSLEDLDLNVLLHDGGSLDITMKEKVFALKGAIITSEGMANHRSSRMGIERVRVENIKKVPVVFGEADLLKVIMTLPGVKSVGEASGGFNVRGGANDQNLILFNEGTIYNPNHLFGLFSAFNTDVVSDVELFKSSIPAEYGGRISSVLDIRGREGNSKKMVGSLGLGLLTSRFHLEGPVKKEKSTFILGGRTTYSDWILGLLPKTSEYSNGTASFYDLNAQLNHKFSPRNSLNFSGYFSRDRFSFTSSTIYRYHNANFSVRWRNHFSSRHSLALSAGYDKYGYSVEESQNAWSAFTLSSNIRQGFLKLKFQSHVTAKHTFSYGFNTTVYGIEPGNMLPFKDSSSVNPHCLVTERALEGALFVNDTYKPTDRLSFDFGLRLSGFSSFNTRKFYGAPELRLSGKYSFLPNLSIKAGFNSMTQYIHKISNAVSISPTDTWKLADANIEPQRGWQAAAGLYWTVFDHQVDLSLEGYYKMMHHYPDYKSGAILEMNENLAEDLVPTKGKAYGAEFMVKKPGGKLNGWLSYTYSKSMLREMQDRGLEAINNGEWYNAAHDKPHDVKLVANYKFTHRYSLSVNLDYSTGRPVTVPVAKYYYGGGYRLYYSERNGYRVPDYFRLDIAMNIEPSHYLRQLSHLSVTFGVYNVTGRKNPYSVFYTRNSAGGVISNMLCVFAVPIPYINLNLKF